MVGLPLWVVFAVGLGSPLLALSGVLVAQLVDRRGARELELRSRREETMRSLRWAAELAVAGDIARAELGVAQLVALSRSDLLDEGQQLFVEAALAAVIGEAAEAIDDVGDSVEVRRRTEPSRTSVGVPSEESVDGGRS